MTNQVNTKELNKVVIRFAGDSGDGMLMTGDQFTMASAFMGNDVCTIPDYPSEIRAPAGTVAGVSGFQLCFGSEGIYTPGDKYDALVAMNPAAVKVSSPHLKDGGLIIVNEDSFNAKNLKKAEYADNPLTNGGLSKFRVYKIAMVKLAQEAVVGLPLTGKQVERCKNFVALGALCWLYGRSTDQTIKGIQKRFKNKPDFLKANIAALQAGWNFAEKAGVFDIKYKVKPTTGKKPGTYRYITGNVAVAMGLVAAARKSGTRLFLGSYPITPATEILQELTNHPKFVTVLQAEDEIAGIGSAIGAAFGGALAATTTSGPGVSLKSEFLGLAVMLELPLVIINVQRGGPSTGLPTKTEQSDLFQAIYGRHGECPLVVLAAATPNDCFDITVEAARLAIKYMTPVIVLTEGALGQGAEAWRVPKMHELPEMKAVFRTNPEGFFPYSRDKNTLARPWAVPGTIGLEHRIGSLEKEDITGATSHDPLNHETMTRYRADKIAGIAKEIPPTVIHGPADAKVFVLGWGGTRGVIQLAVENLQKQGVKAAWSTLRHLSPLPPDLKSVIQRYPKVLIPEYNLGQLWTLIRSEYLINCEKINKVQGRPFQAEEIETAVKKLLGA